MERRHGRFSLTEDELRWGRLEVPDRNGFRGLTCASLVRGTREPAAFDVDGFLVKVNYNGLEDYEGVGGSDIVCFDSAPNQWDHGHAAILTDSAERGVFPPHTLFRYICTCARTCMCTCICMCIWEHSGAFPPHTLFRLKAVIGAGGWEAPGGARPNVRLLVVSATYQQLVPHPSHGPATHEAQSKLCAQIITLQYQKRKAYLSGLDDILTKPVLLMAQEFAIDYEWQDWRGHSFNLRDEWAYVEGPAKRLEGCTPGTRDDENEGLEPTDFLRRVNEHIAERRAMGYGSLPAEHAELTLDEVIACRL